MSDHVDLSLTPKQFTKLGQRVLLECSNYLGNLGDASITPMATMLTNTKETNYEDEPLPIVGQGEQALDCLNDMISQCCKINGRFFGFVTGSGIPIAALADLMASVINQNTIAPFISPAGVAIEHTVVRWMADMVGCSGFVGSLTGGGSLSNLMGLAMARESKIPANDSGVGANHQKVVFYASKEVHMSTPKAMSLLGLGRQSLRLLETDTMYRLRGKVVAKAIAEDRAAGRIPVAIIANAGTTRTGAVDDLDELADLAKKEGLWLHVDGAYGAFAAIVLQDKFKSLRRADSVSLDPHKWLFMPLDCGCLLTRQRSDAIRAFSYYDDYARCPSKKPITSTNSGPPPAIYEESIELSRRFRAFKIWLSMRYHGMDAFRKTIAANLAQAQLLATLIKDHQDLELLAPVELSVVCFRMAKVGGVAIPLCKLDEFNAEILSEVIRRGVVYISKVLINGDFAMRACITNHLTKAEDCHTLIKEVIEVAKNSHIIPYHQPISTRLPG